MITNVLPRFFGSQCIRRYYQLWYVKFVSLNKFNSTYYLSGEEKIPKQ